VKIVFSALRIGFDAAGMGARAVSIVCQKMLQFCEGESAFVDTTAAFNPAGQQVNPTLAPLPRQDRHASSNSRRAYPSDAAVGVPTNDPNGQKRLCWDYWWAC
jgi:hypothetical protein